MKYYLKSIKANGRLLLMIMAINLCIDLLVFASSLPNAEMKGYWVPTAICLVITVGVMLLFIALICVITKKNIECYRLLDEKGPCPELIEAYARARKYKLSARDHCVLASYYLAMDDPDGADSELAVAGQLQMYDVVTKVYYSELFTETRIEQRRFPEAAVMYNNYLSINGEYCRSHPGALAVEHYSNGALFQAMNGNMQGAMENLNAMEKSIKRTRKFAFTRNTALMGVYLIMRDYANADSIKDMMLKDIDTFDGFDLICDKQLVMHDIVSMQKTFDERTGDTY